jgi:hypothetical protein
MSQTPTVRFAGSTVAAQTQSGKSRSTPQRKRKRKQVASKREEVTPSFPTWRQRLEEKEHALRQEVERFLEVLRIVGTPTIDEHAVHFVYYSPDARQVILTGEFTQWDPQGIVMTRLGQTEIFYHTVEFHEPTRVEYKFIVDGQWIVDPLCPNTVDKGIGEQNSFCVVGDFQQLPERKQ